MRIVKSGDRLALQDANGCEVPGVKAITVRQRGDHLVASVELEVTQFDVQELELMAYEFDLGTIREIARAKGYKLAPAKEAQDAQRALSALRQKNTSLDGAPIEELPLSIRSLNALSAGGIADAVTVRNMTDSQLLKLPNLGRKKLKEIRKAVGFNGDGKKFVQTPDKYGYYWQLVDQE